MEPGDMMGREVIRISGRERRSVAGVAWSVGFFPDTDDAFLDNNLDKTFGMPVRCVR